MSAPTLAAGLELDASALPREFDGVRFVRVIDRRRGHAAWWQSHCSRARIYTTFAGYGASVDGKVIRGDYASLNFAMRSAARALKGLFHG